MAFLLVRENTHRSCWKGSTWTNAVHNPMVPGSELTKTGDGVRIDSTFYKQIVGSLMYLTATRPNVMFVVSFISRFMDCPTELHFQEAKRIKVLERYH